MKTERLLGILAVLMQKKKVTAPYLAERFEVSRRTINRDIEELSRAGFPVVTRQGVDGGISLMEEYCLDTTVLTKHELAAILTGLQSLDSVSALPEGSYLAAKIGVGASGLTNDPARTKSDRHFDQESDQQSNQLIRIDLSSFYHDSLSEKIALFRKAIEEQKRVTFRYYYEKGETDKCIEPMLVLFRWSAWYVFGFCTKRQDFRMYKLNRLWNLAVTDELFEVREIPQDRLEVGYRVIDEYKISACYASSEKYRLVEEYGPESFSVLKDGRLYTEWEFRSYEYAADWFLGFGERVEVLGPPEFVKYFKGRVESLYHLYFKHDK